VGNPDDCAPQSLSEVDYRLQGAAHLVGLVGITSDGRHDRVDDQQARRGQRTCYLF
jgi:hypothetical protein